MASKQIAGTLRTAAKSLLGVSDDPNILNAAVLNPSFLLSDPAIRAPLERADALINDTPSIDRPRLFDDVSLDTFALLAAGEYEGLPNLRAWLPKMPTAEQQVGSVGTSGVWAMLQAADFVRNAVAGLQADGKSMHNVRILDYGVCWSRLSRLFYKFTPVERLYGVDAWPDSLNLSRIAGFRGNLALVDRIPTTLPFHKPFNLAYAFSIFTHLSPASADAAARTIRSGLQPGGLFALTIRPSEYWTLLGDDGEAHREQLRTTGFGFTPDAWAVESGNPDYGNSTVSLDYIRRHWTGFAVERVEILPIDAFQIFVLLRAV